MDRLKKVITVVVMTAIITLCSIQDNAQAAVYTYTNNLDNCLTQYHITTQDEFDKKPTTDDKLTVRDVLSYSGDQAIQNGYYSRYNWDLGIKNNFWHKGGSSPFATTEHITVRAYRNNSPQKTCHVFSVKKEGNTTYLTTCL